ncbi:siroheme synthase CysG [Sinorhizobium sp. BG8]|uniref:siroheme synthase CysG n=1 Tax=Sinorhizobium sp. BG8 TaxID=2613773 RepID=UPI00193E9974|nr:siroheme synthase CysG [Sinorhizobium sp. BG8]QRM55832.1 uroporphyrinogen-III C-methyltransferase [Sinorhizobium sp. BG8]
MGVLQKLPNEPTPRTAARVEPLAKLPVFWTLEGRRVLVAGGTDGAAWKAELAAACGATVHVFAEELGETFAKLVAAGVSHPKGQFLHERQSWESCDFDGLALAIGDLEEDDEAEAFARAARAAGVPVNVIDKPAYCDFQFGSIINRSPVVVAVSTDGAAPILAQAIRRRIETLLPPSIRLWASLAQSIRDTVNARLQPGAPRRAFWEAFVDRAFRDAPGADAEADLQEQLSRSSRPQEPPVGRVTLVGAGPGDAEYLTLKAVRALQAADVILFDDLVSDEVLELARREAKRMLVGKRGGRTSCRQEDINQMMVTFAKAGKRVVRLKSGDPMIFGRAGEEIACLERAAIPVDVVPGITAASAMAARLGISLTHRDHAQSVRFVTGHSRSGNLPADVDWKALSDARTTTIFYMGGRTAPEIRQRLLAEGMTARTPVVIVSAVSRANERRWIGNLDTVANGMEEIGLDEPVLIGIGSVFGDAQERDRNALPEQSRKRNSARA